MSKSTYSRIVNDIKQITNVVTMKQLDTIADIIFNKLVQEPKFQENYLDLVYELDRPRRIWEIKDEYYYGVLERLVMKLQETFKNIDNCDMIKKEKLSFYKAIGFFVGKGVIDNGNINWLHGMINKLVDSIDGIEFIMSLLEGYEYADESNIEFVHKYLYHFLKNIDSVRIKILIEAKLRTCKQEPVKIVKKEQSLSDISESNMIKYLFIEYQSHMDFSELNTNINMLYKKTKLNKETFCKAFFWGICMCVLETEIVLENWLDLKSNACFWFDCEQEFIDAQFDKVLQSLKPIQRKKIQEIFV
jgi:hypothetical protein